MVALLSASSYFYSFKLWALVVPIPSYFTFLALDGVSIVAPVICSDSLSDFIVSDKTLESYGVSIGVNLNWMFSFLSIGLYFN